MAIRNTDAEYGSIAKFFHWLIALWVIMLLIAGFWMTSLQGPSGFKEFIYSLHKSSGLTILLLMILRTLWRQINRKPLYASTMPVWQAKAANWAQYILYTLLFLQPLTGWLMSTALNKAPSLWWLYKLPMPGIPQSKIISNLANSLHIVIAWALVIAIAVHLLGALNHLIIRRDGIFQRMWPNNLKKKRFYDEN